MPRDEKILFSCIILLIAGLLGEFFYVVAAQGDGTFGAGYRTQRGPLVPMVDSGSSSGGGPRFTGGTVTNTISVTDGLTTSSLGANFLAVATSSVDAQGKFFVDSSGNISASGTLFNMTDSGRVSSTFGNFNRLSVSTTLYFGNAGTLIDFNSADITLSYTQNTMTLSGGTWVMGGGGRVNDAQAFVFGTGGDSRFEYATAQTPDSMMIGTGADSQAIHLVESGDTQTDTGFPLQTDPTFVFHNAALVASNNRYAYMQAGNTSTSLRTGHAPLQLGSTSGTIRFWNVNNGYATTSIMVTSTGSGGTTFVGETPNGQCFKAYVNNSLTWTVEACGSEFAGVTTTFP